MNELEALKQENNELKGLLKKAKALMLNSLSAKATETRRGVFIASRVGDDAGLSVMSSPAEPNNSILHTHGSARHGFKKSKGEAQ